MKVLMILAIAAVIQADIGGREIYKEVNSFAVNH